MNKHEWIKWQKNNRHLTAPILSFPLLKKFNISAEELVKSAGYQKDILTFVAKNYPISAVIGLMDLSVEAEAFGSVVEFYSDDVPSIKHPIIKSLEDIEILKIPSVTNNRTQTYVDGIALLKKEITDKPVIAGSIGPFSLAGRLMDVTEVLMNCYLNEELVILTLEKMTDFVIQYIQAFKKAGADGIIISEPVAGLLSPDLCAKFSTSYIKKIKDAVCDDNFIFMYHNCANITNHIDTLIDIGADIYHFGEAVELEEMLKKMPKSSLVMGNISPSQVLADKEVSFVKEKTKELLKKCNQFPNFVISTGCDLSPKTKLENIDAYFQSIIDYYNKK
ncbi:uroporphyrinogen decarboxylase family protein [Candidatus Izemoplasma sp. B36]|uniref:uroporphyrinogen decarboxylase family protein n=1 Tax=Candidatus Izemoplasma sp. B36 TaxID=3242468 RepID=UPI00355846F5